MLCFKLRLNIDIKFAISSNGSMIFVNLLNMSTDKNSSPDFSTDVETAEPALYRVLILNDDYTPMDFVVYVLKTFFGHSEPAAQKIMLDVHKKGSGTAGIYSFEIAETKSAQVNAFCLKNKYPLRSILEEETD
jgi:ATP-dependent Clp protease adaptor protein ClpS